MDTFNGVRETLIELTGHDVVTWTLVVALALLCLWVFKVGHSHLHARRDPERAFTSAQRRNGFSRAGQRCELEVMPFVRCPRRAEHGDHFFPHSRGGASTMRNFVAACSKCNLSKSAKMPGSGLAWRIRLRRRLYFPAGTDTRVGQWYRR